MSQPFLVSERLEALAYHMSLTPSLWEKSVYPPSVSASKSTTEYVEHDDQCTARPLQGPPPDLIHELLQVTIDFRQNSPLRLSMKDSHGYFSFRSCLTVRTMPQGSIADQNENDYKIVDGSLHTLIPLAVVLLLQLWIHDGASDDTPAFHMARDILMRLGRSTCDSVIAAVGPVDAAMDYGAMSAFAMIERMSKRCVEDNHQDFFKHLLAPASPACLNQGIIAGDDTPFDDIQNALYGWHIDTLHLMAQTKIQSLRASSKLSLFTALHAFNMVALVQDEQLYVTRNLTPQLGEMQQRDLQTNRQYLEVVLVFLTAAIAKAYPEAVPPMRRAQFSQLFTPGASQPNSSPVTLFVSNVIRQSIGLSRTCRNFAFRLWPKMILVADEFSVSFGGGSFKRTDGGGLFAINKVPFNLREDRDGRRTAVSSSTGLVLKMFAKDKDFIDERNIYTQLGKHNIQHIPYCLGTFRNDWMQVNALLISYEGHPILDVGTISESDWLHLVTIIQRLHGVGIHHHDLKCSNIVRRADGALVVIDFGFAALSDVCETKNCVDWAWLESVHPSGNVPEWFPPPPTISLASQRFAPNALFGICCGIIAGVLLLCPLRQ